MDRARTFVRPEPVERPYFLINKKGQGFDNLGSSPGPSRF